MAKYWQKMESNGFYSLLYAVRDKYRQLFISIDGIDFVTAAPVLKGKQADTSKGGSGYDTW